MYICCLQILTCTLTRDVCCSCCLFFFAIFFLAFVISVSLYISVFCTGFVLVALYGLGFVFCDNMVSCCKRGCKHFHNRRRIASILPHHIEEVQKPRKAPFSDERELVIIQSCGNPKIALGVSTNKIGLTK